MTVIEFSEYFWGEKNEGFNVLYQNMKCGVNAAKDLADLFRELSKMHDETSKAHVKMIKQLTTSTQCGTFTPLIIAFKSKIEKLAAIHNQWMLKLSELVKEVVKYTDELNKTHKKVKEDESATVDAVKLIQDTTGLLQKNKEIYKQRCLELERLKRDNASQRELDRSEAKFRKAQEDYKLLVDKYCAIRDDFERKMTMTSKHFQEVESAHLRQMREFVEAYCQIVDNNNNQWGRVQQDFQVQLAEMTVENLLEVFTLAKYTGLDKPGPIEFEEEKISAASLTGPPSDISDKSGNSDKLSLGSTGASGGGGSSATATAGITRKESSGNKGERLKSWSVMSFATARPSEKTDATATELPAKASNRATSVLNLFVPSTSSSNHVLPPSSSAVGMLISSCSKADISLGPMTIEDDDGRALKSPSPVLPLSTNDVCMVPSTNLLEQPARESGWGSNRSEVVVAASQHGAASSVSEPCSESSTIASTSVCTSALTSVPSITTHVASPTATDSPNLTHVDRSMVEEQSPSRSPHTSFSGWTGFLRRRQKKDKKKKDDEGGDSQKEMGSEGEDVRKSQTPTPDVDEDGFSRQPVTNVVNDPWADFNQPPKKNFYSSSDESDDETKKKIKVEIKPISNGGGAPISASVDELRTAIGGLELLPQPMSKLRRPQSALNERIGSGTQTLKLKPRDHHNASLDPDGGLRRSQSQSQVNKPSQDLLGLTLHPIDPIDPLPANEESSSSDQLGAVLSHTTSTPVSGSKYGLNASVISSPGGKVDYSGTGLDNSTVSATSKEIRDIFGDFSDLSQPSLPPKQSTRPSSVQRERVSSSLIALPRPPSRHGGSFLTSQTTGRQRGVASPVPSSLLNDTKLSIARQDSGGSSSVPSANESRFGLSRGPSPLTLGMSDIVPLAVAFQEVCHACFRGADETQCQVRLIGDMMISFPAGIVQVVTSNPNSATLLFRIKNALVLESVVPNRHLISSMPTLSTNESTVFEFHMTALKELLKKQQEQNPAASYFNIDILKYQVKPKAGAGSCPLQMVAYWKCSDDHTDLRLDYKYNAHAMGSPNPLLNLSIVVPIDGGVKNMQSKPNGTWMAESNRALWKFSELSQHTDNGVGSLRGRFELDNGPGSQGTIAAQFNCEGTTLSGVEFELVGPGYRLSLVKKRFVSGKYVCDGDASPDNRYRYAAPQSMNS